jgi:hypothetical protein
MKFERLLLVLTLVTLHSLLGVRCFAQFKRAYLPDSLVFQPPTLFSVGKLMETDLPGRQLAIVGTMNARDTANVPRSTVFNLLLNLDGIPQDLHVFEDTSALAFYAPKAYAGCYDGGGNFYMGLGSNNRQVVLKSNASGQMLWAHKGNHHEYYSMICEGGSVTFLGQDESIQGAHDFSLSNFDAAGAGGIGMMFGTQGTELPQKMAKLNDQYLLAGSSYQQNAYRGMVVKAAANFEQIWGKLYTIAGKQLSFFGIDAPHDGSGYIVSGRAVGGADSLFLMKIDTAGNPLWTKLYGIAGSSEVYCSAIAVDPISGGYLLCGNYRGLQYLRPYLFMTDAQGNLVWARDHGDPGINIEETLNDIVYVEADGMFYAAGDRVKIDSNQLTYHIWMVKVAADSGSIPCDTILQMSARSAQSTVVGTTVEEQFQANSTFPMGNLIQGAMQVETRCFVIVGVPENAPQEGIFSIVNPSGPVLQFQAQVPVEGADLQVTTLTGQTALRLHLEEGLQQASIALPQLSDGLYLVHMAGNGWRYPTLRWVIQH